MESQRRPNRELLEIQQRKKTVQNAGAFPEKCTKYLFPLDWSVVVKNFKFRYPKMNSEMQFIGVTSLQRMWMSFI